MDKFQKKKTVTVRYVLSSQIYSVGLFLCTALTDWVL